MLWSWRTSRRGRELRLGQREAPAFSHGFGSHYDFRKSSLFPPSRFVVRVWFVLGKAVGKLQRGPYIHFLGWIKHIEHLQRTLAEMDQRSFDSVARAVLHV